MPTEVKKAPALTFDRATLATLLTKIDPGLTTAQLDALLQAAGKSETEAVKALLGQINKLVLGGSADIDESDLSGVLAGLESSGKSGKIVSLVGNDSAKLAALAQTDIGARYAIIQGLPFAITGNDALYDALNRDGSLHKFDPNTGEKRFTDEWFKDRAQFLAVKFKLEGAGKIGVDGTQSWIFEEHNASGVSRLEVNATQATKGAAKMIFASATSQTQTLVGSANGDRIYSGGGDDLINAGAGDDSIVSGSGDDLFAFNAGDGDDLIRLGGGNDTLSLGGGIDYADLALSKQGDDLRLHLGNGDTITFDDWYTSNANQSLVNLQVIAESMGSYNPAGTDTLRDNKVESFDFRALVEKFEAAREANPTLARWRMANSLLSTHLGGSDSAALGGDFAYQYGTTGSLANMSVDAAQALLANAQLNVNAQQLQAVAALQAGGTRLM